MDADLKLFSIDKNKNILFQWKIKSNEKKNIQIFCGKRFQLKNIDENSNYVFELGVDLFTNEKTVIKASEIPNLNRNFDSKQNKECQAFLEGF